MGLSTHVLDTFHGTPAVGMRGVLFATDGAHTTQIKLFVLGHDGRPVDGELIEKAHLKRGTYRLVFEVAAYFCSRGVETDEPSFLGKVSVDFGVAQPEQHYHVPLIVSPWSYSTYRGA